MGGQTNQRKRVVLIAPHFPPCNLAGVHRARLIAHHLPDFGYEPIVLSVDARYYEEPLDFELEQLVPPHVRVVRCRALPVRPVRLVGDIGIRSLWHQYHWLCRAAQRESFDLLVIPIPPNYSALLGPWVKRRFGIPYVIDYIDPWVYPMTPGERWSWKAWGSHALARLLEPLVLRHADAVTAVAASYYAGAIRRQPGLGRRPRAAAGYGGEPDDHAFIRSTHRPSQVLDSMGLRDRLLLVYAGAVLPRAVDTYIALFEAARRLKGSRPDLGDAMHFLFVGTSSRPDDPNAGLVQPMAERLGVTDVVTEVAARQPYLEVLAILERAHAVMVLGSSDPHYSPSKLFQAILSQRLVFALLHQASPAIGMLADMPGVELVTFSDSRPVRSTVAEIAGSLEKILSCAPNRPVERSGELLDRYSARAMTQQMAQCFDQVLGSSRVRFSVPAARMRRLTVSP